MVRDDRFHDKKTEQSCCDEGVWMSAQVLSAVKAADGHGVTDEHKQEVLKVLLSLSCHAGWRLNGRLCIELLTLCLAMYGSGARAGAASGGSASNALKAAAQAAVMQNVQEYCKDISKGPFALCQFKYFCLINCYFFKNLLPKKRMKMRRR